MYKYIFVGDPNDNSGTPFLIPQLGIEVIKGQTFDSPIPLHNKFIEEVQNTSPTEKTKSKGDDD